MMLAITANKLPHFSISLAFKALNLNNGIAMGRGIFGDNILVHYIRG